MFLLRCSPAYFSLLLLSQIEIAIGSGDCPIICHKRLLNFPHAVNSALCNIDAKDRAPILQFSSVFHHTKILPHMLAMPMPLLHLPCFKVWATSKIVCKELKEDMVFGQEGSGLTSFEVILVNIYLDFFVTLSDK
jgi:hypothetical protein